MTKEDVMRKLTSRKFWLATAAMLGTVSVGLAGVVEPKTCAIIAVASMGIYSFCEAYVDGKRCEASQSNITTVFEAKTVDKDTVQTYLASITGGE